MSRSKWKGVFISFYLLKKYLFLKNKYNALRAYTRASVIVKEFVGMHFKVYNGVRFFNLFITEEHIGFKFGEFAYTRRLGHNIHLKHDKKKKKKIKK